MIGARSASAARSGTVRLPGWGREHIACAFTLAAMVLGGGGSAAATSELLLQMAAAAALVAWLAALPGPAASPVPRPVLALGGIALALPVIQLLPLPPALWQALPGREAEAASLALVGSADRWMPWTMTPARTLASLLAIVPPVLAMAMVSTLGASGRNRVLATIVAAAAASVLLGALQLGAGSSGGWQLYSPAHGGYLTGFQANRNAQADVLLIAMAALAAVAAAARERLGRALAGGGLLAGAAVLSLACLLTGSRTGIVLVPLALLAALVIWRPRIAGRRALGVALGGAVVALAGAWLVLRGNHALGRVAARFSQERDFRFELWEDTRFAIAAHWPFGSGVGSFRPVFIAAERLEVVDPSYPVRAHNEYLEIMLEGGIFAPALLLAAVSILVYLLMRAWRERNAATRPQVLFAGLALSVVALHSFVDYPLRSMALAHLAAVAAGTLAACARQRAIRADDGSAASGRAEMERPQS